MMKIRYRNQPWDGTYREGDKEHEEEICLNIKLLDVLIFRFVVLFHEFIHALFRRISLSFKQTLLMDGLWDTLYYKCWRVRGWWQIHPKFYFNMYIAYLNRKAYIPLK